MDERTSETRAWLATASAMGASAAWVKTLASGPDLAPSNWLLLALVFLGFHGLVRRSAASLSPGYFGGLFVYASLVLGLSLHGALLQLGSLRAVQTALIGLGLISVLIMGSFETPRKDARDPEDQLSTWRLMLGLGLGGFSLSVGIAAHYREPAYLVGAALWLMVLAFASEQHAIQRRLRRRRVPAQAIRAARPRPEAIQNEGAPMRKPRGLTISSYPAIPSFEARRQSSAFARAPAPSRRSSSLALERHAAYRVQPGDLQARSGSQSLGARDQAKTKPQNSPAKAPKRAYAPHKSDAPKKEQATQQAALAAHPKPEPANGAMIQACEEPLHPKYLEALQHEPTRILSEMSGTEKQSYGFVDKRNAETSKEAFYAVERDPDWEQTREIQADAGVYVTPVLRPSNKAWVVPSPWDGDTRLIPTRTGAHPMPPESLASAA